MFQMLQLHYFRQLGAIFQRPFSTTNFKSDRKDGRSRLSGNKVYDKSYNRLGSAEIVKIDLKGMRFFNKRHLREHKKMLFKPFEARDPKFSDIYEHKYGTRGTGIRHAASWEHVPEKVPEIIVPPDLDTCDLKPYVSYSANIPTDQVLLSWFFNERRFYFYLLFKGRI